MKELKDYSGPFIRNIRFEDLSKEVLGKLLHVYSKEFLVMDAYWQKQVSKRVSEEVSRECIIQNWSRIGKYEMEWTMEALNVKENDIEGRHLPVHHPTAQSGLLPRAITSGDLA